MQFSRRDDTVCAMTTRPAWIWLLTAFAAGAGARLLGLWLYPHSLPAPPGPLDPAGAGGEDRGRGLVRRRGGPGGCRSREHLRHRANGDHGYRQRHRLGRARHQPHRKLHSAGRVDQPGQLGGRPSQRPWSAGRHQYRHLLPKTMKTDTPIVGPPEKKSPAIAGHNALLVERETRRTSGLDPFRITPTAARCRALGSRCFRSSGSPCRSRRKAR